MREKAVTTVTKMAQFEGVSFTEDIQMKKWMKVVVGQKHDFYQVKRLPRKSDLLLDPR